MRDARMSALWRCRSCDGAENVRTRHEVCFHNSTRGTAGAMLLNEASPGAWLSMLSVALFVSVLNLYVLEHVRGRHGALASWRRVLLVISHPDDESMFFGPTIQALRRAGARTHILCLSNGDADGLGAVREKELESARKFLRRRLLGGGERFEVEGWIQRSVAGGNNRRARGGVCATSRRECRPDVRREGCIRPSQPRRRVSRRAPLGSRRAKNLRVAIAGSGGALVTVNPLRKFLTFGDVFASFALESHVLVAATSAMEVRRAMSLHRSQWVWVPETVRGVQPVRIRKQPEAVVTRTTERERRREK